jgi:hypothetical protein
MSRADIDLDKICQKQGALLNRSWWLIALSDIWH